MQDRQLLLRIINSNMTFEQMRSLANAELDAIRQALNNAEMELQERANALEQEALQKLVNYTGMRPGERLNRVKQLREIIDIIQFSGGDRSHQ